MEIMKKYIKEIVAFAIGVLITSMAFLIFRNHQLTKEIIEVEKPVVKIKTEIVTKTDTIFKTITKPQYMTETIIRTDTIKQDTILPLLQRDYITSINTDSVSGEIYASVSGYNAVLDTLSYKLIIPTKTITNSVETQITKYKQKHWNFTVGVGAGYGVINRKADIFVGGVVGYSF